MNHEVLALGKVLINCDALEIYLNGETWGQESIPQDFFVQPVDKKNYTVSLLKDTENGRNYLMVVNNNFSKEQSITLAFDASITSLEKVSKTDGSLSPVSFDGGKLKLTLAAGDGELFALPEGLDFSDPLVEAPVGTNLAQDGQVTCNSSTGTADQYMDNLNDGNRTCEASGTLGWVSNGVKESEIVIDIGYATKLNRVDVYPAATGSKAGKNFGKSVKISVSTDGTTWTEVFADDSVNAKSAIPSFTFAEVNARYVKLDIANYGQTLAIAEIEVYMDNGTVPAPGSDSREEIVYTEGMNIALNRPIEVSSQTNEQYVAWGWAGKFINDGNKNNGWTSNVKIHDNEDSTEYVIIDFGDLFALDKVVVTPISDLWPKDFEILVSVDGETWVSIEKQTNSKKPSGDYVVTLDIPVEAAMIKFEATKLRSTSADGYMLQLAEIEAYGAPICDKSTLQSAIDEYTLAGGDTTAEAYVNAQAGMDNQYLTSTSMDVLIRALKAAMPKPDQTTEQESVPPTEDTTAPDGEQISTEVSGESQGESEGKESKGGCKSAAGVMIPVVAVATALVCTKKKKKDE